MTTSAAIPLKGAPGSPYTRKMLALMRFRRIPYQLIVSKRGEHGQFPKPKVELLPTFYLSGAGGEIEAVTDSTPIIRRLEREHQGRSVIPPSPTLRFLDELIEDYGDEWLTKAMFHYRWHYAADIDKSGSILPLWRGITASPEQAAAMKKEFSERQIGRLRFVGSSPSTAAAIEASYKRFLDIFETHLHHHPYWLGQRPGSGDFAVFGQLTQLAHFDPTPSALSLSKAPRVVAWTNLVEDLSGLEVDDEAWLDPLALPLTLGALFAEIGRVYVPVMLANARALKLGQAQVNAEIEGLPWQQQAFPYQGKCVQWLRQSYAALPSNDSKIVRELMARHACLPLLEDTL
jgi:glutathione S-transferase